MLVYGFVLAFIFGALANRLRLSPLVGYLLAGVVAGPFTPGFVGDAELAPQLAEIGVILLMFGVGLHFSLRDLMSVRAIAIPGAVAQITVATLLRSEEHTSELQSLMRISYAVFCLKNKKLTYDDPLSTTLCIHGIAQ